MSLIEKTAAITISHPEIDADHDVFIELVNKLEICSDAEFGTLFTELFTHTQQHFERENALMAEFKFPAIDEHKGEHHRVLGELTQFKKRVDKGMISFGRAYIKDRIPQWFSLHVTTMDSALNAHIKQKSATIP